MGRQRSHLPDVVLVVLAILFGIPSLGYPFGHDQGLYYYVGREWLHGSVPYRDVFDHKPPGIYVIHAVSIALFGEHMWSIRICDLMCVLLLGVVSARLVTRRGESVKPGLWGASCVMASLTHYGYFGFWESAQSEIWYGTFSLAGICICLHARRIVRIAGIAGAIFGIAFLLKPPALLFAFVAIGVLAKRAVEEEGRWRKIVSYALAFGLGFTAPIALAVAYFAATRGLAPMMDIVVGANSYYVAHDRPVHSLKQVGGRFEDVFSIFFPFSFAVPLYAAFLVVRAHQRRATREDRNRGLFMCLLFAVAVATVCMQQKFYWVHWLILVVPGAAAGAFFADMFLSARWNWQRGRPFAYVAIIALIYSRTADAQKTWYKHVKLVAANMTGRMSRESFAKAFDDPAQYHFYGNIDASALWIAAHSNASDNILVRGFNPEIYAISNRRYQGRFFWSLFLVSPARAYRRDDYVAEDNAAFLATKPRYVVTLSDIRGNLDSPDYYLARGYRVCVPFGKLTVMSRNDAKNDDCMQPPSN